MLDKISMSFYAAYLKFKLKLMELEEEEDGMETLETVILIAVAVVIAVFLIGILTKDKFEIDGEKTSFIGWIFKKIANKFNEIFE